MRKLKALLLVATAVAALGSTQAPAQNKLPTLSQGTPFSETRTDAPCNASCAVLFTPVPAGKILVIQNVTGSASAIRNTADRPVVRLVLTATGTVSPEAQTVHSLQMNRYFFEDGSQFYLLNTPMLAFVAPGGLPPSIVSASELDTMQVTISGYLIDASK